MIRLLPLPQPHPFTQFVVVFRDLHVAFEVATWPSFLTRTMYNRFAHFIVGRMLLAFASALGCLFVFELSFDGSMSADALLAHELQVIPPASPAPLVRTSNDIYRHTLRTGTRRHRAG